MNLINVMYLGCPVPQDIINQLTNPLETLTVPHLVKKFPEFQRTRSLIPTIARALQPVPILSQINPLHARPSYLVKTHFNTIFLSTPRSSKPYFSSVFPTKLLYSRLLHTCYRIHPSHPSLFHNSKNSLKQYESRIISFSVSSYFLPLMPK